MALGISRYRGYLSILSLIKLRDRMEDYTDLVKDILMEMTISLKNSLRELIHIQSRVIQKKIHIKKNVSSMIWNTLLSSCLGRVSHWFPVLERKPIIIQRHKKRN